MNKKPINIAFIDDEQTLLVLAGVMFKGEIRSGTVNLQTFQSAKEFLDYEEKNKFDFVFSDINMPDIDGFELLERLKQTEFPYSFCFISAYEREDYIQEGLDKGAQLFFPKPINWLDIKNYVGVTPAV